MTAIEAREILSHVHYRGWEPVLGYHTNGAFWLQWVWRQGGMEQRGQRWYVSNTLTTDDLVRIARQAVEAIEQEATRRHFLYYGEPVFSDTLDVELLRELHTRARKREAGLSEEQERASANRLSGEEKKDG